MSVSIMVHPEAGLIASHMCEPGSRDVNRDVNYWLDIGEWPCKCQIDLSKPGVVNALRAALDAIPLDWQERHGNERVQSLGEAIADGM